MPEVEEDRGVLNREVKKSEGYGIPHDLPAGTIVYRWYGQKFGFEKGNQILVTAEPGKRPFFSIPRDAVDWDEPVVDLL